MEIFNPRVITLNYEADQASRQIRQGFWLWTFYLKLKHKVELVLTNIIDKRLKHRLDQSIDQYKAQSNNKLLKVSPFMTIEYSWTYWKKEGSKNFGDIINKMMQKLECRGKDIAEINACLLLGELCQELNHKIKLEPAPSDTVLLFDSQFFFSGGHLPLLEESLDIISTCFSNTKCYFFLDQRMILLPSLAEKIVSKYPFCEVIDATNLPICFSIWRGKLKSLNIDTSLPFTNEQLSEFNSPRKDFLNPILNWGSTRVQKQKGPTQTAWQKSFSKEYSKLVVEKFFAAKGLKIKTKEYVAIHSRSSNFLAPNIRNSLPLKERESLIDKILDLGLGVVVLGINRPEDKYWSDKIVYIDELDEFDDSFQIHLLNGAIALIGSPSGVTHLTYCTNTPTLLFDMPYPCCPNLPNSSWLSLMKPLFKNGRRVGVSEFYNIKMSLYATIDTDGQHNINSPLLILDYDIGYNTNNNIFKAFCQLLRKHYSIQELNIMCKKLRTCVPETKFSEKSAQDRELIKKRFDRFSQSGNYQAFGLEGLADANWLDMH